jgi:ribosomal protein S12 methylthiotransferase accessory factor
VIEKPRLKAHLSAHAVRDDELFLLGDDRQHVLRSAAAVRLAPMLDGTRTVPQLAIELGSEFPLVEVMGAVAALERGGHLADGNGVGPEAAWWEAAGRDATRAAERVAASGVALATVGDVPNADELTASLRAAGLAVRDEIERCPAEEGGPPAMASGAIALVLAEDYLCTTLDATNRAMTEAGRPWLLAKPVGETLWLGPWFRPGDTGCWACLRFRLERNRQVEAYIRMNDGHRPRRAAATPPGAGQLAAGMLARELESVAADGTAAGLEGRVVTIARDLATRAHELTRRPQCPVCGAGSEAYGGPEVRLSPAPKRFVAGGAWRTTSADETLERLEGQVSPIAGAVAWVADLSDPAETGYACWAGHWFPSPATANGMEVLRQNVRGRSGGKGPTREQARAGAICESLERYAGCFFGDEPRVRATGEELGERALDIGQLVQFSERQYATREATNAALVSEQQLVPLPLPGDREIDWTEAWSLTSAEARLVPTAYCYYGHPDVADRARFFCVADSNGQGAGNTLEEAITQGLMELVERDAVGIWWYNRLRAPAVDLESFGESWLAEVRTEYAAAGRRVWALDLTTDIGIPAFAAVSAREGAEDEDLIFGFGAHLEPRLALARAFSELHQFLPVARRDARTGELVVDEKAARAWWERSSLDSEPYLLPDADAPPRRLDDFSGRGEGDIADGVRASVALLAEAGLETFVVDQTRPDIDLRVVKVIVPGLRHFWRRLAPGRLYDVPVRMGRLEAPTPETELNPKDIWF